MRQTADCAPHLPAQDRRPAAGHLGWVGGWVGGAVQHGRRLDRGGGCCCVSLPGRLLAGAVGMRDCLPPASRLHARLPICPLAAHPNPLQPSTPCARPTSAWHAVRRGTTCGTGWCRAATGGPCPHASSPIAGSVELYCSGAGQGRNAWRCKSCRCACLCTLPHLVSACPPCLAATMWCCCVCRAMSWRIR